MRGLIAIYRAQFSLSLLNWLQYRVGMIFWFIVRVVEPLIYISVWSSIANNNGGTVNGLTVSDIAAYYIAIMVVNQMTFPGLIGLWGYRVKTGALSSYLLRPVSIFHRDLANLLANKAITLTFIVPTVVILTLLFQPALNTTPLHVICFIGWLLLAFFLRFILESLVGITAFWITHRCGRTLIFCHLIFLLRSYRSAFTAARLDAKISKCPTIPLDVVVSQ